MEQNSLFAKLRDFYVGFSSLAHISSLTEKGSAGSASSMVNVDVLGEFITQGSGLTTLSSGTEAGAVTELINHILDVPPITDYTFGISATKLHKISSTAVTNASPFPQAITSCVSGKSVAYLKGGLYYFFKRASDGAIGTYNLDATFNHAWQTGLQKTDLMPSATKEDILMFGHGRYVGVYFQSTASMNLTRLDFGDNHEVADIVFHGNQWIIAVNSSIKGTNRGYSQIFSYAGGATTALLTDEASVGLQRIGFLFVLNGVVYVCYSAEGVNKIGYLAGRRIMPLVSWVGELPTYAQKSLYKNTILFASSGLIYSAGAVVDELPFALSQHADGGYETIGAIATPFNVPLVASTEGTSFRLAKFSGYDTNVSWRSVVIPVMSGRMMGYVDEIIVRTFTLGSGAKCDLKCEYNDASSSSAAKSITGAGLRIFVFPINSGAIENFRIFLDWSEGSATNSVKIKEIVVMGHFLER